MKFGLENITALCAALDNPERAFQSVIVGGTNGKGSVTAMMSAALHAAGHRVARYTSPHLERLEERFVIDEREVAAPELRDAAAAVQHAVEAAGPSGDTFRAANVLRVRNGNRIRAVQTPVRGDRRAGSRAWRPPRRHQRRVAHRGSHYVDRLRSSGAARRHPGVDRCGEGRHHQAGDPGRLRARSRPRPIASWRRPAVHAVHGSIRALDRVQLESRLDDGRTHRQPPFALARNQRDRARACPAGIKPPMLPSSCACSKSFRRQVARFPTTRS